MDQEPRERKNDEKPPPLLVEGLLDMLGSDGSDWSELEPVVRSFREGMGWSVGSGASWLETFEALEDGFEGNSGAGLPAWASKTHPARKETTLVMTNQIRRPSLIGFMVILLLQ